jgi:hypothetical protein
LTLSQKKEKKKKKNTGWGLAQAAGRLPSKCKVLSSNPSTTKKKEATF